MTQDPCWLYKNGERKKVHHVDHAPWLKDGWSKINDPKSSPIRDPEKIPTPQAAKEVATKKPSKPVKEIPNDIQSD